MRLTKKLMKDNHEELWWWLHEDPKREKPDWPRWKSNGGDIPDLIFGCFPCEYDRQHSLEKDRCCCPLEFYRWGRIDWNNTGHCLGGLYENWRKAQGKKRTNLAKQIAELPVRKRR